MAKGTAGLRKFVSGSVVNIAIIGGVVLAAGYAAKKLNLGGKIVANLEGAGNVAGQGLIAPISGLVQGFNLGGQGLAQELGATQEALFHQFAVTQDQFNKFFHPDWYNPDGSYSTSNPNYGKLQSSIMSGNNPQLPPTSTGTKSDPNGQATNNGAGGVPSNPKRPSSRDSNTNPTNPGSNLTPNIPSRSQTITTIKPTTSRPSAGQITPARPVTTDTLVRGLPLNQKLINVVQAGGAIQSSVLNTRIGGIREVAGSPGLMARLAANLKSG